MNYGYTTLATDWDKEEMNALSIRIIKAILFFIPSGNLDHEKLYPKVEKWLIEIDDNGIPMREIGLNENNKFLFSSPNDRNIGFWTDSPKIFHENELETVTQEYFELIWSKGTISN
ncbi:MAG: hypothetical protein COA90_09905 [Gammaproteobacteria bacterium]|nr:MAG: hypothetical protein COA90_09905 [Gammaproteobacteria bacterium]